MPLAGETVRASDVARTIAAIERRNGSITDYNTASTTEVDVAAATISGLSVVAGRSYRAVFHCAYGSSVDGDRVRFRLRRNAITTGDFYGGFDARCSTTALSGTPGFTWTAPNTETITLKLSVSRTAGTGTAFGRVSSTDFYGTVEDLGEDVPWTTV